MLESALAMSLRAAALLLFVLAPHGRADDKPSYGGACLTLLKGKPTACVSYEDQPKAMIEMLRKTCDLQNDPEMKKKASAKLTARSAKDAVAQTMGRWVPQCPLRGAAGKCESRGGVGSVTFVYPNGEYQPRALFQKEQEKKCETALRGTWSSL
jgi:hypothetical protein